MNVHIVEHPNTAHADVHLYSGPQVNAPNNSPIKTAASIRAILSDSNNQMTDEKEIKIITEHVCITGNIRDAQNRYKPKCTISFKRNVANVAKYASN